MFARLRGLSIGGAAVGLGILAALGEVPRESRMTFLQVGQGDCAVLQHGGRTVLFDAAPKTALFDAGERLAARQLQSLGVRRLDVVVLSHPDLDHVGGLPALARRFPVGRVVVSRRFARHTGLAEVLRRARIPPSRVTWVDEEARLSWEGCDVSLRSLPLSAAAEENQGSLWAHVRLRGGSALLTGDSDLLSELRMVSRWPGLRADILKASHHGSRHGTGERLLAATRPRYVVVSCGRLNSHGHPHAQTLERVRAFGAELARTDREGPIQFVFSAEGVSRR